MDLDWSVCTVACRQRMKQMRGTVKIHAGEQGEIVAGLQQPEMIEDSGLSPMFGRKLRIGFNLPQKRLAKIRLLARETRRATAVVREQSWCGRRDRRAGCACASKSGLLHRRPQLR